MSDSTRSVYKGLVLYPLEDMTHEKALQIIDKNFRYKAITHDRDTDENGELKKTHVHVVVKLDSTMTNAWLAEKLEIKENYIQKIYSLKGALDYLTHRYTPDKFQYDETDLIGDLELYDNKAECEDMKLKGLLDICFIKKPRDMRELIVLSSNAGMLEPLRKNSYLFTQLLKCGF